MTDEKGRPMTYWGGSPAAPVRIGSLDDALKYAEFLEADRDRLATALSLAQTEIKGHMRVAKEVRVDALEEAANACEALGRTPGNGIYMASARACADAIRELKSRA